MLYGKGILSAPPSPLSPAEFDAQLHFADKAPNSRRAIVSPAKRSEPEERKAESPASSLVQPPNPNVPDSASGQSSADDARSTSGEAPVSETSAAPSMLYSVPCTLHLTAAAIQTSEDDLLADLNKVSRVLDLFLNNQISEGACCLIAPVVACLRYPLQPKPCATSLLRLEVYT